MTATIGGGQAVQQVSVISGQIDLLQDHRILGVQILPGAAFVNLAVTAVNALPGGWSLESLRMLRPLPIAADQQMEMGVLTEPRADGTLAVRVRSRLAGTDAPWREHAAGQAMIRPQLPQEWEDVEAIKARALDVVDTEEMYFMYALTGIELGTTFQSIQHSWMLGRHETFAEIHLAESKWPDLSKYMLHPGLLDGYFQSSYGVLWPRSLAEFPDDGSPPQWTMVPYQVSEMVQFRDLPVHGYSHIHLLEQHATRDLMSVNMLDLEGRVCVRLKLLSVRIAVTDVIRDATPDLAVNAYSVTAPSAMYTPPTAQDAAPAPARAEPAAPAPAVASSAPAALDGDVLFADSVEAVQAVLEDVSTPVDVRLGASGIRVLSDTGDRSANDGERIAWAPALHPSQLGNPEFMRTHGVRYAYVVGEMANGITSEEMVSASAKAGLLAFFGSGGLDAARVEKAIHAIRDSVGPDANFGVCLLHDVHDVLGTQKLVDLFLAQGVHCANASAYVTLTPAVVQYRVSGLHQRPDGEIVVPNRMFAKVSREEVARRFLEPPPQQILEQLLRDGKITEQEAALARHIPMVDDLTAEADSGGHTDRQPLVALLPSMRQLRDQVVAEHNYARPVRVGAGGGLGTPESVAAAFTLGADYILTGSVNQSCVEAGTSELVRQMLAEAGPGDVAIAADPGSFEMGSTVQVLRRGTMFAARSQRLLELYRRYPSLDEIPERERKQVETTIFRRTIDEVWQGTQDFFNKMDPRQLERAAQDEHHRMALVMRWYLGLSSSWAQQGLDDRKVDFQVWCGPAMGAFNGWVRGSHLERIENRTVVDVAENLMHGAAAVIRRQWLTAQGVPLTAEMMRVRPRPYTVAGA